MFPIGTLVRKSSDHSQRGICAGMCRSDSHQDQVITKNQDGSDVTEAAVKGWEACLKNGLGAGDVVYLVHSTYTGPVKIVYVGSDNGDVNCTRIDEEFASSMWVPSGTLFSLDEAKELFEKFKKFHNHGFLNFYNTFPIKIRHFNIISIKSAFTITISSNRKRSQFIRNKFF